LTEVSDDKKTILLVEDEYHVRNIAKVVLEIEGFNVIQAENGREALDLLSEMLPDLIITDIMMPRMDGVEFFLTLKESDVTAGIPVIVLTVKSQVEDIKYASLLGMEHYVIKPFDPRDLVREVKELLKDK
jgi:DNA-binding response OmpR family regulator